MKSKIIVLIGLLLITASLFGQRSRKNKVEFENCYTSLELALTQKDSVFCLDLTKQKLTKFPMEVFEFKNLKVLILDKNKIDTVPPSIAQLTKLEVLKMYRNNLEDMTFVTLLPSLKSLDLADNYLEKIPDDIDNLKNMTYLDLSQNILSYFPKSLGYLENLEVLDLTENETNRGEQSTVRNLLPDTEVKFSPPCNCNFLED